MKRPLKILLIAIFGASLAMNAMFLAYHVRIGTFRRALVKLDLAMASTDKSAFQAWMETRYRDLPNRPTDVVFAGDSLIYNGPWIELSPEVQNRGIPKETSGLLLGRLVDLIRGNPRKLVLLTGANDFIHGVPVAQLVRNYRTILERVHSESPGTSVVVIGMLPVDSSLPGGPHYDNPSVVDANRRIEAITREIPGIRFLDLAPRLTDQSGQLRREFTEDGLHLTREGYLAVREDVRALLAEAGAPGPTSPPNHASEIR